MKKNPNWRRDLVAAMYAEKKPLAEIAKASGFTKERVRHIIKLHLQPKT